MILAGDVGGTKVDLALFDFVSGKLKQHSDQQYPSKEYSGLEEIVKEFLAADKVTAACFGVPGPVRDGRLRLTNLPWTLDSRKLAADLGIDHVFLINDLEANGYGLAELDDSQIFTLNRGRRQPDWKPRADFGRNRAGRVLPGLERSPAHSLPIRGWPRGLCSAQRR